MAYASLVIIFNKKNEVLLLKRSEKVDSFRGLWGFPGGKREDGELSLEAAVREVKEETDLDILKKDLTYVFTMRRTPDKDILFYITNQWKGTVSIDWESQDYAWRNPNDLGGEDMVPTPKIVFDLIKEWSKLF